MKKKQKSINNYVPLLSVGSLIMIWHLSVIAFDIKPYLLPSPIDVLSALFDNIGLIWQHAKFTLFEAIIGLLLSIIVSYIFAIIMDLIPFVKRYLYPLFIISQTIPLMAIAPLMIIWIGLGVDAKIMVVMLVCIFPMTINIMTGLASVEEEYLSLFKIMKASTWNIYKHLKIPHSLPFFFSGLKIAATYAILGALIAEYMGAKYGLGIYLSRAMSSFDKAIVFAIIIVIVATTLALIGIVGFIEKQTLKYKEN